MFNSCGGQLMSKLTYGEKYKEKHESYIGKPIPGSKGIFLKKFYQGSIKLIEQKILHRYNIRPMVKLLINMYNDRQIKDLTGCEIGVGFGFNSYNILYHLPVKKMYLVDPYARYSDFDIDEPIEHFETVYNEARERLKAFGNKAVFIRKKSEIASKDIPDNSLDFIYIDGNHFYEYVKKDIELYYPKLKSGGVMGGHDFTAVRGPDIENADVPRAVIEFIDKKGLELDGHPSDWWFIKP